MFLPLGSIPRHGWKESLRLPKAGAHQMIALTPWLRAAERTEGRCGELNCLRRTTYSESARFLRGGLGTAHPLPLPKNKGAVGTHTEPSSTLSVLWGQSWKESKDMVNAPGHLKFLLQDWEKSERRLRKVEVASRVMNARHDPPPDQKAASWPMAPPTFSTPSSIPLQSATSSSPSESSPGRRLAEL